jgi:hypothetical protein
MAVQTYTPHELLRFKKAPVGKGLYGQLQAKLRQDQELGTVSLPDAPGPLLTGWNHFRRSFTTTS